MTTKFLLLSAMFTSYNSFTMQAPFTQVSMKLNDHEHALLNLYHAANHLKYAIDNCGINGAHDSSEIKELMKKFSDCSKEIEKKLFKVNPERAEIVKAMSIQKPFSTSVTELD